MTAVYWSKNCLLHASLRLFTQFPVRWRITPRWHISWLNLWLGPWHNICCILSSFQPFESALYYLGFFFFFQKWLPDYLQSKILSQNYVELRSNSWAAEYTKIHNLPNRKRAIIRSDGRERRPHLMVPLTPLRGFLQWRKCDSRFGNSINSSGSDKIRLGLRYNVLRRRRAEYADA